MTLSTQTEITASGTALTHVVTYANDILPDTLGARLPQDVGQQEDESHLEGQLIIRMKNTPQNLSFAIDEDSGHLLLLCETGDEDNYSLDSDGNLIYTTND
jgi:hypothetical protein